MNTKSGIRIKHRTSINSITSRFLLLLRHCPEGHSNNNHSLSGAGGSLEGFFFFFPRFRLLGGAAGADEVTEPSAAISAAETTTPGCATVAESSPCGIKERSASGWKDT